MESSAESAMAIKLVCVDKKILEGFKKRALKALPCEVAEEIWAKVRRGTANITHFQPVPPDTSSRDHVEMTFDAEMGAEHSGARLIGSLHSHPSSLDYSPSDEDLEDACMEKERVMGICCIGKKNGRRFFGFAFYARDGRPLRFVVAE